MYGKITVIATSLMALSFAPATSADHSGSETCLTPDEWEPDELCITLAWNGPIERVQDRPNRDHQPPVFFYGMVELTICVEVCVHNVPSAGISLNPDICTIYFGVTLAGGSCDPVFVEPYYRMEEDPTKPPEDIVCVEQGRAAFFVEEHQSGPGISNVPIARLHAPDSSGNCPPQQGP